MSASVPFPLLPAPESTKPIHEFFAQLHAATENPKRGRARRSEFKLWTKPDTSVFGWKFNEYDYGKASITLPTNARGLFTIVEDGKERIAVRGYDKFFNIDEVPETKWRWIEQNTRGPYEVTSKENGCIVFMSGLADGTLIVTSKQSTGPREGPNERNHSWVAQQWVERHLASKNVSSKDFAKLLYDMNTTAVGELCDDSFEEHVLAYPGDKAGIYLHGLNLNVPQFTTYPFESIEKFASQFGFHTTDYLTFATLPELKTFLEGCAETGTWKGVEVEGFVIRSKAQMKPGDAELSDFFFKYKFEEPYLMYRQWRELSRSYIGGKSRQELRIKNHKTITNHYLDFVIPLFNQDPQLRAAYQESHGIIEIRQKFLDSLNKTGSELIKEEVTSSPVSGSKSKKYILVPISTVGCGKTTVAVALTYLFPSWGHFQNDDLTAGNKPQRLVSLCLDYFTQENVVFLDRNNHQFRERAQLFADFPKLSKFNNDEYVFIALNFNPYSTPKSNTKELTSKRILKRGDNHQSIYASSDNTGKIMGIINGFKTRFQPFDTSRQPDEMFDSVIELACTTENSSRLNLEKVITTLHENYPELVPNTFSRGQLDEAYEFALEYKPKSSGPSTSYFEKQKAKTMKAAYFGIKVDFGVSAEPQAAQLAQLVDTFFSQNQQITPPGIWAELKEKNRVQRDFHVTLVHSKQGGPNSADNAAQAVYRTYNSLFKELPPVEPVPSPKPEKSEDGFKVVSNKKARPNYVPVPLGPTADLEIVSLAWTDELMVFEVKITSPNNDVPCSNTVPHITVGTRDPSIKAMKAGESLAGKHDKPKLVKFPWNIEPRVLKNQKLYAFP